MKVLSKATFWFVLLGFERSFLREWKWKSLNNVLWKLDNASNDLILIITKWVVDNIFRIINIKISTHQTEEW
jgi:hypothetical protein